MARTTKHRIKTADKVLCDIAFNIAKNPKYDGCQRGLTSMVYKFFEKSILVEQLQIKLYLIKN